MYGIIYRAYDSSNGKSYIGQTTMSLEVRKRYHLIGKSSGPKFKHALAKRPKSFVWSVLSKHRNQDTLNAAEIYWIKYYDSIEHGYNLMTGGGQNGKHSDETKAKISAALVGHRAWNKGKPNPFAKPAGWKHTKATKAKMSSSHMGKVLGPYSSEHRAAIGKGNLGKIRSAATIAKLSKSHIGQVAWNRGKKLGPARCLNCGQSGHYRKTCTETQNVHST